MPPRTPLLRPDRFFAERDPEGLRLLLVGLLLVASIPAAVWGAGSILQARIDGTVTVDNPNRPSEAYCQNAPESVAEGCDAPADIERDIDTVLGQAIGELVGSVLVGSVIVFLALVGLLHGGAWLLDAENGVGESVALRGLVPSLLGVLVLLPAFSPVVEPMTVTPDVDPGAFVDRVRADVRVIERWAPLVTGATAVWSAFIWRYGLLHERGLSNGEATGLAGTVAVLFWLGSLI